MAKYTCKHCGAIAHSKCIFNRSVFLNNLDEALYGHLFKRVISKTSPDPSKGYSWTSYKVEIAMPGLLVDEPKEDFATVLRVNLKALLNDERTFKEWLCDHEWELNSERCELGCCVRKSTISAPKKEAEQ